MRFEPHALDATYAALADPTRRAILDRLKEESSRVTDLARPFTMSLNAVSKHIRVLEAAGLVEREIRGREHRLSLKAEKLRAAAEWLEPYRAFWEERLDRLEELLIQRRAEQGGSGER